MLLRSKAFSYQVIITLMLVLYSIAFIYFNQFAINNPYIGIYLKNENAEYRVSKILPTGLGEKENVEIGDKVVSINQQPVGTVHTVTKFKFIEQASQVEIVKKDGSVHILSFHKLDPANIQLIVILSFISLIFIITGTYTFFRSRYKRIRLIYFTLSYTIGMTVISSVVSGIGNTLAYSTVYITMVLGPALLFTTLRYFPHYYVSSRLDIINKFLYIGGFLLVFAYLADLTLDTGHYSLIRQSIVYWFIIGIISSVFLIIQHYITNKSLETKNQLHILLLGIVIGFLPVIAFNLFPVLLHNDTVLIPFWYTLMSIILLPISFSYIMLKQRIIDVNFHLPKLVAYTALFLLAITFHLFWQYVISSSFVNQDLIVLFDFFGILLLILSILILYRVLPPFMAKKIFGHHDQMQKQKNELMSKLIKNEHIYSILDFLLSSINQIVPVKAACIVIEKEQKKEYIKSTGLFVGQEHTFMDMSHDISEIELESVGIDSTIPISYQNEVHGFIYLGEKVNGSRLEKEELSKINDLLEYGSNVVFSAIFIHQLEKEKQHLFDNNQMVQREVSQLQMYNDLLLEAQERERKDLSTYLHDEILQNAIFLNRALEAFIENKDQEDLMYNKDHIKNALEISSQVVLDIREKCFDLYPAMIEDIGFVETCEYFFTNNRIYTGGAKIAWSCDFTDKETQTLSMSEQKIIYRCVKELVMNAIKHAKSQTIEIKFEKENDQFIFSVTDDGKGFTVPSYLSKKWVENKNIGLITVKQNIERIGGHLDISSSKDKGTKLSIWIRRPIEANKNKREVANEAYSSVVSR